MCRGDFTDITGSKYRNLILKRDGNVMPQIDELRTLLNARFKGEIRENVPLAGFTTFNIGGPADLLAFPEGEKDLSALSGMIVDTGINYMLLGRGSNMLISDRVFRGVVIVIDEGLRRIDFKDKGKGKVYVEAGCDLNQLINRAIEEELGGLEDLAGIPGTVGGAVRMNAGAMGCSIGNRVDEISVFRLEEGQIEDEKIMADRIQFNYRETSIEDNQIIYKVKLKLYKKDRRDLDSQRKEVLHWRRENQPLGKQSAGSVFRNPEGISAGELIDRCGLKGMRIGGAMVSKKHANFIINMGGASAEDVCRLMDRIKSEVSEREGIELSEEIKIVGRMREEEP